MRRKGINILKVVFMGTPDIAATVLKAIIEKGHDVAAVVTQPDKPKGRGREIKFPPVKELAISCNIPVYQPQKIKNNPEIEEKIRELNPDIIVVAAYGQILPKSILDIAKYGCVNVHASLLPKYRGAAPIQWAIIDGEKVTGVTTMMMDAGLDTGDMLDKTEVRITDLDTAQTLHDKLAEAGGRIILSTMEKLEKGTAVRTKQRDEESTYARMLTKELGKIDFTKPAEEIERLIRGLNPWPSAYTTFNKKTIKIWKASVMPEKDVSGVNVEELKYGQVAVISKEYFGVRTGKDILCIRELQLEGKKRMDAKAFLSGVKINKEDILGE